MGLIRCPECKGKLSDQAPQCPHCGYAPRTRSKVEVLCPSCEATLAIPVAHSDLVECPACAKSFPRAEGERRHQAARAEESKDKAKKRAGARVRRAVLAAKYGTKQAQCPRCGKRDSEKMGATLGSTATEVVGNLLFGDPAVEGVIAQCRWRCRKCGQVWMA